MRSTTLVSLSVALLSCVPLSAHADIRSWMKIDTIPGESLDDRHAGEIDLESFSQAFGTKNCSRLVALKNLDSASPGLIGAAVGNLLLPSVIITMRKEGIGQQDFFKATLGVVLVERVDLTGEASELREQVVLKPRTIRIEYRPQRVDGSLGPPIVTDLVCT
jgi:type VI secretion system secreted protein Hcp